MSRIVLCTLLCGVLVGPVLAKGHHGAPVMPRGAYPARAAVGQQRAISHAAVGQQRAMTRAAVNQQRAISHAAVNQQRAVGHAAMTQARMQQNAIRHAPHPGGIGPGPGVRGRGLWRGPAPHDLHRWRRGPAPHPHYRSCWFDDIWYDAYGYPYYYGTTVVAPAPAVVAPAPVVVAPAPAPVVVTPAPVVAPAPVVVTPPPPPPPPAAVVY